MHVCVAVHVHKAEATSGAILRNTTHLLTQSFTGPTHGLELTGSAKLANKPWDPPVCHSSTGNECYATTLSIFTWFWALKFSCCEAHIFQAIVPSLKPSGCDSCFTWQDKKESNWERYWRLLRLDKWDGLQREWLRKKKARGGHGWPLHLVIQQGPCRQRQPMVSQQAKAQESTLDTKEIKQNWFQTEERPEEQHQLKHH